MAHPKYSGVRYKNRTFRDDSSLVALPYEQTVQAKPPIPIPPRNPSRSPGSSPTLASSTLPLIIQQQLQQHQKQQQHQHQQHQQHHQSRPLTLLSSTAIIVAPPLPPKEQHPALRDSSARIITAEEPWKRDSGLARTTSSAATIVEEDEEDDDTDITSDRDRNDKWPATRRRTTFRDTGSTRPSYDKGLIAEEATGPGGDGGLNPEDRDCVSQVPVVVKRPVRPSVVVRSDNASSTRSLPAASTSSTTTATTATTAAISTTIAVEAGVEPSNHQPNDADTQQTQCLNVSDDLTNQKHSSLPADTLSSPSTPPESPSKRLIKSLGFRSGSPLARIRKMSLSDLPVGSSPPATRPNPNTTTTTALADHPGRNSPTPSSRTWKTATTVASSAPTQPVSLSLSNIQSTNTLPTPTSPRSPRSPAHLFSRVSRSRTQTISPTPADLEFSPISVQIPNEQFLEDDFITNLTFSNRGSVMLGGKKAIRMLPIMEPGEPRPPSPLHLLQVESQAAESHLLNDASSATASSAHNTVDDRDNSSKTDATTFRESVASSQFSGGGVGASLLAPPAILLMPSGTERESQKVRSLYEYGEAGTPDSCRPASFAERLEPTPEDPRECGGNNIRRPRHGTSHSWGSPRSTASFPHRDSPLRHEHELAGGMEDWEDVRGADIDRYGFITPRRLDSRSGSPTELKSCQLTPRRRNMLLKRDPMGRAPSRKVSARSLNTQHSEMSTTSRRSTRSAFRQASNMLPHNRDRRWMDDAGDMLSMAPMGGLEEAEAVKMSDALKKKEWERTEKWRKMAKIVKHGKEGQGMEFDFDTKNPKLIDRTWKGIPDRWRAAAWYSFMRTSARQRPGSASEQDMINDFHRLQERCSADDGQIDLDVPRTINHHIMFRRRYRGGQRLLFRVLHAISIYFPETGYVQGMASLAATLLCYFDEERCFVMMVRMWMYRGLETLYSDEFENLILALKDFETKWIGDKDVAKKITELDIHATAYGPKWYLTLFNLSIPFPAQLRVWDVFLLLGGTEPAEPQQTRALGPTQATNAPSVPGLDVLHAASAALMHALRDNLLNSDFENAMKALTLPIPVRDEELLMKVTRAEWKLHCGKKRG